MHAACWSVTESQVNVKVRMTTCTVRIMHTPTDLWALWLPSKLLNHILVENVTMHPVKHIGDHLLHRSTAWILLILGKRDVNISTQRVSIELDEYSVRAYKRINTIFHAPINAHPSYLEAINHKIITYLPMSIHETNILSSIWLRISLKLATIMGWSFQQILKKNKHPPKWLT